MKFLILLAILLFEYSFSTGYAIPKIKRSEYSDVDGPDSEETRRPFTNGHGFQFLDDSTPESSPCDTDLMRLQRARREILEPIPEGPTLPPLNLEGVPANLKKFISDHTSLQNDPMEAYEDDEIKKIIEDNLAGIFATMKPLLNIETPKTYGMNLTNDKGNVWNELSSNTPTSYNVGVSETRDNIEKDKDEVTFKPIIAEDHNDISDKIIEELEDIFVNINKEKTEPKSHEDEEPITQKTSDETKTTDNGEEIIKGKSLIDDNDANSMFDEEPKTYGMSLTMDKGNVWNELVNPPISFIVGESESTDQIEEDKDEVTFKPIIAEDHKDIPDKIIDELEDIFVNINKQIEHNSHEDEEATTQKPYDDTKTTEKGEKIINGKSLIDDDNAMFDEEPKTYGMSLTMDKGNVWNELNDPPISYNVGESESTDHIENDKDEVTNKPSTSEDHNDKPGKIIVELEDIYVNINKEKTTTQKPLYDTKTIETGKEAIKGKTFFLDDDDIDPFYDYAIYEPEDDESNNEDKDEVETNEHENKEIEEDNEIQGKKTDMLVEVMKDKRFWKWLGEWMTTYMELLTKYIQKVARAEVEKALKEKFQLKDDKTINIHETSKTESSATKNRKDKDKFKEISEENNPKKVDLSDDENKKDVTDVFSTTVNTNILHNEETTTAKENKVEEIETIDEESNPQQEDLSDGEKKKEVEDVESTTADSEKLHNKETTTMKEKTIEESETTDEESKPTQNLSDDKKKTEVKYIVSTTVDTSKLQNEETTTVKDNAVEGSETTDENSNPTQNLSDDEKKKEVKDVESTTVDTKKLHNEETTLKKGKKYSSNDEILKLTTESSKLTDKNNDIIDIKTEVNKSTKEIVAEDKDNNENIRIIKVTGDKISTTETPKESTTKTSNENIKKPITETTKTKPAATESSKIVDKLKEPSKCNDIEELKSIQDLSDDENKTEGKYVVNTNVDAKKPHNKETTTLKAKTVKESETTEKYSSNYNKPKVTVTTESSKLIDENNVKEPSSIDIKNDDNKSTNKLAAVKNTPDKISTTETPKESNTNDDLVDKSKEPSIGHEIEETTPKREDSSDDENKTDFLSTTEKVKLVEESEIAKKYTISANKTKVTTESIKVTESSNIKPKPTDKLQSDHKSKKEIKTTTEKETTDTIKTTEILKESTTQISNEDISESVTEAPTAV